MVDAPVANASSPAQDLLSHSHLFPLIIPAKTKQIRTSRFEPLRRTRRQITQH